jgi:hypothetical protein
MSLLVRRSAPFREETRERGRLFPAARKKLHRRGDGQRAGIRPGFRALAVDPSPIRSRQDPIYSPQSRFFCNVTGINSAASRSVWHKAPHVRDAGSLRRQASPGVAWETSLARCEDRRGRPRQHLRRQGAMDRGYRNSLRRRSHPAEKSTDCRDENDHRSPAGRRCPWAFHVGRARRLPEEKRIEIEGYRRPAPAR